MSGYPQRKSPRLQGYDYSLSGAYFVTICTHHRKHLFGLIDHGNMFLSNPGELAEECWLNIPIHYPSAQLDAFVIMPNHMHGILIIDEDIEPFKTVLGRIINAYKGAVTARTRQRFADDRIIWQSRYHDHIIRNETDLHRIREYVANNVLRWSEDVFFNEV